MQSLTTYIDHPEQLDAQTVEELWQLVDRHPTYQAARLLLVRGLYLLQDQRFGPALREAALMVPDRAKLFDLIEGEKFRLHPQRQKPSEQADESPKADRTQSLIDTFLAGTPEPPKPRRQVPVDASVDYMSYLLQLEDAPATDAEANEEEEEKVLQPAPASEVQEEVEEWPEEVEESDDKAPSEAYFTETLARIYIKQGKYDKAIEIIRRLSLNYPKKNRYFADQIRFLEKILLNERSKNSEK